METEPTGLRIGVLLPTRNVVTSGRDAAAGIRQQIELAAYLDDVGCDSLWVGDSLLGRPRPEPVAVLAAMASRTQTIELGTSALLPAMRNPLQMAQQLATLDLLSAGRLIVGVGSGFPNAQTRLELDALGIPYKERVARCHEAVGWCKAAWDGPAPKAPRFWDYGGTEVLPKPGRADGPPFWLGGASEAACRAVGKYYDGWMPTSPDPQQFENGLKIVKQSAGEEGRDPATITAATVLTICIDDDPAKAHDQLRRFIEGYYQAPLEGAQQVVGCRAGTLETIVSEILSFKDAGAHHIKVRFASADQETEIKRWIRPLLSELRRQDQTTN